MPLEGSATSSWTAACCRSSTMWWKTSGHCEQRYVVGASPPVADEEGVGPEVDVEVDVENDGEVEAVDDIVVWVRHLFRD